MRLSSSRVVAHVLLVSLALFTMPVRTTKHASIKSKYAHQLVTSSTLRWRSMASGRVIPETAVASPDPDRVICRAEHHGTTLLGQTDGAECDVAFVARVHEKSRFEILENVDLSAKLEWKPYARFVAVPEGAVTAVDTSNHIYIGRHLDPDSGRYLTGAIGVQADSYSFGLMTVMTTSGQVKEVSSGEVLVEVEPERYELRLSQADSKSRPKLSREDVVLAKSSLLRFYEDGRDREARLQKVLSYDYEKSEYYGQIPGMIRALPATIYLTNGQAHAIMWGLPQRSKQKETLMVGYSLKHQTAVDVSVVGVKVTEEQSYSGILTSIYSDGARRERKVSGVIQRKYLNNIRPEYSRVYQIKDSIVVTPSSKAEEGDEDYATTRGMESSSFQREDNQHRDQMLSDSRSKQKTLSSAVTAQGSGSTHFPMTWLHAVIVSLLSQAILAQMLR